jgi:hypothetical protein
MADVFISYKREERAQVERIAERLRGLGLTVWFDARLPSGESFDEEINRELHEAKCVLVCWSPGAVQSQWVRAEAAIGRERDVLAAVMLAPAKLYPPFNLIHSIDLANWDGADLHPGWLGVVGRIGALADRPDLVARAGRYAAVSNAGDDDAIKRVTIEKRRGVGKTRGLGFWAAIGAAVVALGFGGWLTFEYLQARQYQARTVAYEIEFEGSAQGLQVGDTVRFNGVNVGEVAWVGLSAENPTHAVARIDVLFETPVREDSIASVEPLGATGMMVLEITPGTMDTQLLRAVDGAIPPRIRSASSDPIPTENIWVRGEYWLDDPRSFDLREGIEVETGGHVSASPEGRLLLADGDWVLAAAGPEGWPTYQNCIDAIRATEPEATAPTYVDQTRATACRRLEGTIVTAVHVLGAAAEAPAADGVEFRYVVWGGP